MNDYDHILTHYHGCTLVCLEVVCSLPDPMRSLEEYERYVHDDVGAMPAAAIAMEADGARLRLRIERPPEAWFVERLDALEGELKRRARAGESHDRSL